ncbi:DUF2147 domain-containing protein [Mesorhizobium sp. CU2]|uniref:DUF2147 domain-containing protein n=1 Tax=unclassified Mesorhizobium TaxID=325217 RepID=UPI00112C549E|nr:MULTISPECIES: DUF2147 domain-containing protein [unclassified Mesorhizobium]TPN81851.1 DUF2147 domain-containing protein [Mesorhizobium sp. CU3]TPO11062.1 DUF2147 domain-containing protein [Mesorhizobium sp. CU2]
MRGTIVFLSLALATSVAHADAFAESRGVWMRDDGNARVSIAPCGQQLCATNLWIRDTSKGEQAGDKLIMTLRPTSGSTLTGKAYDPKRNRTYSMTLQVTAGGLTTRGCMAAGLICRNVHWTPAK